ncbi:MAG: hypothetical protein OEZ38_14970, partial [Gammaproteobacteria bacterium]|nr:hypothetical protein [Gammaproteobacteria bacterium]
MMKKTLLAMALFLTSGAASAATGEFCMFNSDGSINNNLGNWSGLDCDPGITATIVTPPSGVGNSISSSNSFYGIFWNAHDITTYGPGDYSVDTIEGGIYNFTVGPGQIGVHMLFDWNTSTNIDVVNIWDITENPDSVTFTSTDWDGDGILGGAMIDGPFSG